MDGYSPLLLELQELCRLDLRKSARNARGARTTESHQAHSSHAANRRLSQPSGEGPAQLNRILLARHLITRNVGTWKVSETRRTISRYGMPGLTITMSAPSARSSETSRIASLVLAGSI